MIKFFELDTFSIKNQKLVIENGEFAFSNQNLRGLRLKQVNTKAALVELINYPGYEFFIPLNKFVELQLEGDFKLSELPIKVVFDTAISRCSLVRSDCTTIIVKSADESVDSKKGAVVLTASQMQAGVLYGSRNTEPNYICLHCTPKRVLLMNLDHGELIKLTQLEHYFKFQPIKANKQSSNNPNWALLAHLVSSHFFNTWKKEKGVVDIESYPNILNRKSLIGHYFIQASTIVDGSLLHPARLKHICLSNEEDNTVSWSITKRAYAVVDGVNAGGWKSWNIHVDFQHDPLTSETKARIYIQNDSQRILHEDTLLFKGMNCCEAFDECWWHALDISARGVECLRSRIYISANLSEIPCEWITNPDILNAKTYQKADGTKVYLVNSI